MMKRFLPLLLIIGCAPYSSHSPNPFNSSVTIPLNEEIHTVSIYNILGETIKKYSHVDLISKNQIVWNGLDKYGNEVSTGTYFVILVSDNKIQTRKVVFAK